MNKSTSEDTSRAALSQGDIIHRPSGEPGEHPRWGFILTADCDISQDKSGARLSYLEIVTARYYLEHVWSSEVLRKMRAKIVEEAVSLVAKAAKALADSFDPLPPSELLEWLKDTTAAEIVAALEVPEKKRAQYIEALESVELAFTIRPTEATPIERLKRIWTTQKQSEKSIRARLHQALDYNKATDFHLIPSIPGSEHLGFIVLLREVSSVPHSEISASPLEYKISGNRAGFYIAGPSNDNLRYAIAQKMAFLFSRIGMNDEYESQCEVVTQLAVSELFPDSKEEKVCK